MKTAFILAAGVGSRMMPLTKYQPKALIKINNQPMINYILDLLEFYKFDQIGINLFHKAEKLQKYLKAKEISFVTEKKLTGTGGGVLAIYKKIQPTTPFLVISSDMMINFDLSKIYQFHLKHKGLATICCYFRPKSKLNLKKSGQVLFDKRTKKVIQILERSEQLKSNWINSGVYIFNPEIINILKTFRKKTVDIPEDLIPVILAKNVFAYAVNHKKFYQLGIDTPDRIKIAESDLKSGKFVPVVP